MAKTPVDKPTRLDVQRLLRDLFEKYRGWRTPAMRAALQKRNVAGTDAVEKVNRLFQAQGLTPEVQRQVTGLAKKFNAGK